jgi:hypothetical protein
LTPLQNGNVVQGRRFLRILKRIFGLLLNMRVARRILIVTLYYMIFDNSFALLLEEKQNAQKKNHDPF